MMVVRASFLVACGLMASGCLALNARLHAGPTVDSDGQVDIQGGVAVGFGYAFSTRSAVTGALGVSSGTRNALDLTDTIEYVRLPDEGTLGGRIGVIAQLPLVGDDTGSYLQAGATYALRRRSTSGGHEKSFHTHDRTVLALGIRGRFGALTHHDDNAADDVVRFAGGADLTLDWWSLSRWSN
jgi:hypothetical protein